MKKLIALILTLLLLLPTLASCGEDPDPPDPPDPPRESTRVPKDIHVEGEEDTVPEETEPESKPANEAHIPVEIKPSPDKYTWYIKDYVGKNAASFGYTSFSKDRMDRYGAAVVKIVFVAKDGTYVDISDEEVLKKYVVTAQNIEPNTEMKLSYMKDSRGREIDYFAAYQSIETIVLAVKEKGDKDKEVQKLTAIKPSPDKYTWYINDYVGRNLLTCGYTAFGGTRRDSYGNCSLELIINSTDGAFIDCEDPEVLKQYVVISQDIPPNTELKLEYLKLSNGEETENIVSSKNIADISLTVTPIG